MGKLPPPHERHVSQRRGKRGQSLAEFALVLPVLLLILAGVLEVSNLLTAYNRIQLAAREGARFGAAGGTDSGVADIVKQTLAQDMTIDSAQMSVLVVRPVVEATSTTNWNWSGHTVALPWGTAVACVYGTDCTERVDPATVLTDLKGEGTNSQWQAINGSRMVVVAVYYRVTTLLNLPFFRIPGEASGRVPLSAYSVIEQEIEIQTISQLSAGCSAYPIAIESTWLNGLSEDDTFGPITLNVEFSGAGFQQGFAFLAWHLVNNGTGPLAQTTSPKGSLWSPGNSLDATNGFLEYDSDYPSGTDTSMHRNDWVTAVTGASITGDIASALNNHKNVGRSLRVIVYNYAAGANPGLHDYGSGQVWQYQISNFAVVRINAITSSTITFEFVRTDTSCGYDLTTP